MISYMWAVLNWFKEDLLTVTWSKLLQSLIAEGEKREQVAIYSWVRKLVCKIVVTSVRGT